jgi:hypothetical protein
MKNPSALMVSAGLGAVLLGAIVGGLCGAVAGKARRVEADCSAGRIDKVTLPPEK